MMTMPEWKREKLDAIAARLLESESRVDLGAVIAELDDDYLDDTIEHLKSRLPIFWFAPVALSRAIRACENEQMRREISYIPKI